MPSKAGRTENPYTVPRKYRGRRTTGESASSRRLGPNTFGYNRRIRGPQFPVETSYIHVDSAYCIHCVLPGQTPHPPGAPTQ